MTSKAATIICGGSELLSADDSKAIIARSHTYTDSVGVHVINSGLINHVRYEF